MKSGERWAWLLLYAFGHVILTFVCLYVSFFLTLTMSGLSHRPPETAVERCIALGFIMLLIALTFALGYGLAARTGAGARAGVALGLVLGLFYFLVFGGGGLIYEDRVVWIFTPGPGLLWIPVVAGLGGYVQSRRAKGPGQEGTS